MALDEIRKTKIKKVEEIALLFDIFFKIINTIKSVNKINIQENVFRTIGENPNILKTEDIIRTNPGG